MIITYKYNRTATVLQIGTHLMRYVSTEILDIHEFAPIRIYEYIT